MPEPSSDLSAPVLLVAMPQVLDPFFHRSVVLLLNHDEEGSHGLIVNRPTDIPVRSILGGMDIEWSGEEEAVAYFGGPVQPQLGSVLFLADERRPELAPAATAVTPAIAITHHVDDLAGLAAEPPDRMRLLLGFAGWGEGQLMEEILRNDWLTARIDPQLLFAADPAGVWGAALRSVGVDPAVLPSWTQQGGHSAN
jgi:putative transcriptional regulator